ncbi:MAG: hypothetical protein RBU29_14090, partial [bacterium]|nr:hypothetical protein [bacterium]
MRNGMLLRRAYIVLVVVCLLCSTSQATVGKSTLSMSVDILMMDEGLPTNEVRQIYKDSTGFMWFMSNAGIVKYDSMELTVFTTTPRDPRSIS